MFIIDASVLLAVAAIITSLDTRVVDQAQAVTRAELQRVGGSLPLARA